MVRLKTINKLVLKRAKGKVAAVEIKGKFGRNPSMTIIFTCPSTSSMSHSLTLIKIWKKTHNLS